MAERAQETHGYDNDGELILTGSSNAYVAATARPISGYFQGLRICGKANHTNTGAATLNVNGLGAVAIRKLISVALVAGDIVADQYCDFIYDATNGWFQMLSPASATFVKITGDTMTGPLTVPRTFTVLAGTGDNGGTIHLKEAPNSTLNGTEVVFDQFINRVRILENGSPFRGAYLDLTECGSGAGSRFVVTNSSLVQGDIIYYDGTNFVRLAPSTAGRFLRTGGAAANPSWVGGNVIQTLQTTYTTNADLTTTTPIDDTTPTSSEGTQVLSQAITPLTTSSTILCKVSFFWSGTDRTIACALFRGSTCIHVKADYNEFADRVSDLNLTYLDSPATTSSTTYTVRVGSSGTIRLNGNTTGRFFGGAAAATLTLMEIAG